MQRRTFLTASTVAIAALAGCGGETEYEDGNSGNGDSSGTAGEQESGEQASSEGGSGEESQGGQIELLEHELTRESSEYGDRETVRVAGTAENTGDERLAYAEVRVRWYDADGNQLDSSLDNINDLDAGQTWAFEVQYLGDGQEVDDYDIGAGTEF